jgi:hypothetical protein
MGQPVPQTHFPQSIDPDGDLATFLNRRKDLPETIAWGWEVMEHADTISKVKDSRFEGQMINIPLHHMATRTFGSIGIRYFDPFADVQTHHLCPELLRPVQMPSLSTTNVHANFPAEEV